MQITLIKNNKIDNIIVVDLEVLPQLGLDYDEYIDWKIYHEIGQEYIDGVCYKEIDGARHKYNEETNSWELVEEVVEEET
jgi:hypothetical protein